MADMPASERSTVADLKPLHIALIIIFGIFATTLPQPQVLGRLPLMVLLKNELHVDKEGISNFFFLCGLFWYLKPFAGILTDAFPLFKTRRRWYLLISATCAAISWIALGLVPHTYAALLLTSIIVNLFMVMASTVIGAYLVEAGQRLSSTGRLTSLRLLVQNLCTLINGPFAGFLAGGAFMVASGVSAALVLSIVPVAWFFLRERPVVVSNAEAFTNAGRQLRTIVRSGPLLMALFFILVFYFAPGFGTVLFFKQQDELKLSTQFIGNLGIYSGAAGILATIVYSQLIKHLNLRTMLLVGVACAAGGTLFYLMYSGPTQASSNRSSKWLLLHAGRTSDFGPRGASRSRRRGRPGVWLDALSEECRDLWRRHYRIAFVRCQMALFGARVPECRHDGPGSCAYSVASKGDYAKQGWKSDYGYGELGKQTSNRPDCLSGERCGSGSPV
jgi:MFS family permease